MKKVSIVIPTRNRAHLLRFALKSAVQQTYPNIEIVVCDNDSNDNTQEVVDSFDDKRIVYFRTTKSLSMPDNWEYALSKTSGEYITYLTDDSFLLPNCITIAISEMEEQKVKVVVWKHCAYFASDWLEPARRNLVYIPNVTSKSYRLKSSDSLKKLYDMDERISTMIPKSLNSLIHRKTIEDIMKVQKNFFLPSCPDYTSAASTLLNINEYLLIDKALYIDGVTTLSIGATTSLNLGESSQKFISEFSETNNIVGYLGIPASTSCIGESLQRVREFYLESCPEVNEENMLCAIADRLIKVKINGGSTDTYFEILSSHLATRKKKIRLLVEKQKIQSRIKWTIIKKIRSSPFLVNAESLRNARILKGARGNFHNIEECANRLLQSNAILA